MDQIQKAIWINPMAWNLSPIPIISLSPLSLTLSFDFNTQPYAVTIIWSHSHCYCCTQFHNLFSPCLNICLLHGYFLPLSHSLFDLSFSLSLSLSPSLSISLVRSISLPLLTSSLKDPRCFLSNLAHRHPVCKPLYGIKVFFLKWTIPGPFYIFVHFK